jgi:uncharacterized protein (TIRG00374 family)
MYLAFKGVKFSELFEALKKTNYLYIILGAFFGVYVGSWIRALRWQYLLDPLKEKINLNSLFSATMIGYMMNAAIPRAGELTRPLLIAKKENISKASAIGTIVVERIFDMLSMLIVFGLCLFYYREEISRAFGEYNIEAISLYTSLLILVFVITVVIMLFNIEKTEILVEKISAKLFPAKIQDKIKKMFISLINGFLFVKYPKSYFKIFITTILLWISYVLATYIAFYAFNDIQMNKLNIFDANIVLTMTTFAMTIPLPGNSAGTYHFFVKTALVGFFAVDNEVALSYATVNHLVGIISLVLIGLYYSLKENYKLNTLKT